MDKETKYIHDLTYNWNKKKILEEKDNIINTIKKIRERKYDVVMMNKTGVGKVLQRFVNRSVAHKEYELQKLLIVVKNAISDLKRRIIEEHYGSMESCTPGTPNYLLPNETDKVFEGEKMEKMKSDIEKSVSSESESSNREESSEEENKKENKKEESEEESEEEKSNSEENDKVTHKKKETEECDEDNDEDENESEEDSEYKEEDNEESNESDVSKSIEKNENEYDRNKTKSKEKSKSAAVKLKKYKIATIRDELCSSLAKVFMTLI